MKCTSANTLIILILSNFIIAEDTSTIGFLIFIESLQWKYIMEDNLHMKLNFTLACWIVHCTLYIELK